jgi:hypothetical protein
MAVILTRIAWVSTMPYVIRALDRRRRSARDECA